MDLEAFQGEHPTRLSNDPPSNLESLIQAAKGDYGMTDSLFIDTFDRHLPQILYAFSALSTVSQMYGYLTSLIVDGQSLESWGAAPMLHSAIITISPISSVGNHSRSADSTDYPQYWSHTASRYAALRKIFANMLSWLQRTHTSSIDVEPKATSILRL